MDNCNLKNSITTRHSTRSYTGEPLSHADEQTLLTYLSDDNHFHGVMGHQVKVDYVKTVGKNLQKVSTYGVVKKAPAYLVASVENTPEAMVDCGYVMEKLILYLNAHRISTCWLGGTFNRKQFEIGLKENVFIPIIIPVGYPSSKRTLVDRSFRYFAGSDHRKANQELFFNERFGNPIKEPALLERLSYVRRAPSASNKQPWRIVMDAEDRAHLFLERTPGYNNGKLGYDIQMVDMGIAMCHYEIAMDNVNFKDMKVDVGVLEENTSYVISMI